MKIGTILKLTYIAGMVTGAVGLSIAVTAAKGVAHGALKLYTVIDGHRKKKGIANEQPPP